MSESIHLTINKVYLKWLNIYIHLESLIQPGLNPWFKEVEAYLQRGSLE
jgi:hypothetical protein